MDMHDDSASRPDTPSQPEDYEPLWYDGLQAAGQGPWDWLWQGYLAPGNTTLLTSLWKSGKSTLISVLLARMKTRGMLAGFPVRQGRAVVISEEPPLMWHERGKVVDLAGHVAWFCQPFRGRPRKKEWRKLLDRIARLHAQKRVDLLVIDSLAKLVPLRSENDAVEVLRGVQPLEELAAHGVCTLIAHHPKKGAIVPGQAARGSGALPAHVDIVLEMLSVSRRLTDRRRRVRAFSRHAVTPPSWVIEWTADGTDYRGLGLSAEPEFEQGWPVLQGILLQSDGPLTRRDLLRHWPDSAVRPAKQTLWKWLTRAVKEGQVLQDGQGNRKEPYRYRLPGMDQKWQENEMAALMKRLGRDEDEKQPPGERPSLP